MSELRYLVTAHFDTKAQAEQARQLLASLNPAAYRFSAWDKDGNEVWSESGNIYRADDVRL